MKKSDNDLQDRGKQKHRTVKIKLKSIIRRDEYRNKINDIVLKINKIVTYAYQFLRMFVLEKYDETIRLDRQFIYNVLKCVCNNNEIECNNNKYKPLFDYYNKNYKNFKFDEIDSKNTSFILQYSSIEMATCIDNNIMNHFKDYLNKYINILFLHEQKKKINENKKYTDKTKKEKLAELTTDVKNLKLDLYTNSELVKYEGKHKKWLDKNRKLLVPEIEKDNINYHLKKSAGDFIKYAIYINKEIEKLEKRPFQIIPQRNNCVPKHITFDHSAIVDILGDSLVDRLKTSKKKAYVMLHPKEFQQIVFKELFDMKHSVFRQGKLVFNYQFKTDGVATSLDFVSFRKDKYKKQEKKKENIKSKTTKKELLRKPKDDESYNQLEKLTTKEIKEINDNYNVIGLDPGKKSLASAIDTNGKVFQYNAVERRHECYHKFSHLIIKKEKEKHKIDKKENKLSDYSCRTLNKEKYMDFVHNKNKINKKVNDFYQKEKFRNIQFRRYSRTKQEDAWMLNRIEKHFNHKNKPIIIGYGNWSRSTQMKNFFPTPCKGFRNLIASRFKIVIVDEFKTSMICNKTGHEMEKWKYNINGKLKECHKVLTSTKDTNPKGETECRIFVDRDINGAKNILKITKSWLKNKTRPKEFCREIATNAEQNTIKSKIVGKPVKVT